MNKELVDLTVSELQAYRQRKLDRVVDYSRNMHFYLDRENWERAEFYRKAADEVMAEVYVIEHCIKIVKRHESK